MEKRSKIFIASDHRGYKLNSFLLEQYPFIDLGPFSEESVDYNDYAKLLVNELAEGDKGVLICYSGLGMSIAANRYPKARAALAMSPEMVKLAREHNDANILVLSGLLEQKLAKDLIKIFLDTPFSNEERHKRRIEKLQSC